MTIITLKKGEGRTVKSGGLWIYDNEIASTAGSFSDGDIVEVRDFDGFFLGYGFINRRSKIAIRLMSRHREQPVNEVLLEQRVRDAWTYRKTVMGEDISSCRVIFGEADFLPGLTVDKFSDVLVVESLALGIDRLKLTILDLLVKVMREDGIFIRGIYERSDAKVRLQEGMERVTGFIGEPFDTSVEIIENGVRYMVDVKEGQKTGFFLDQKYNRRAVAALAKGKRVLDCFTHTGSFALHAAKFGAADVTGVDISEFACDFARENAALNGFDNVQFVAANAFDYLKEQCAAGEQYDVVILDPPAFTKTRAAVEAAARGYKEINLRGMKLVKDGGYLVTCSFSKHMLPGQFKEVVLSAARDARVHLFQVDYRTQGRDHPILPAAPETQYLKCGIFRVDKV